MDGKVECKLADLNAKSDPSEYTVFMTRFTEVQEAYGCADFVALSCMINVVDFAIGRVSDFAAGMVLSLDAVRCTAKRLELQIEYSSLAEQLRIVTSEYDTWHLLAIEHGDDTIHL